MVLEMPQDAERFHASWLFPLRKVAHIFFLGAETEVLAKT